MSDLEQEQKIERYRDLYEYSRDMPCLSTSMRSEGPQMGDLEQEQNCEKYRELYEYSRDIHFKQLDRLRQADQKAAIFLSAVTVFSGFVGLFGKAAIHEAIPPTGFLHWIFLGVALLTALLIVGSWLSFLAVLKVRDFVSLRLDDQILDFFRTNRRIDIHFAMSKRASEAVASNSRIIDAKFKGISRGHLFLMVGVSLLLVGMSLFVYMRWVNPELEPYERTYNVTITDSQTRGELNMPEEKKGPSGQQRPDQPDDTVVAPANVVLKEGIDFSNVLTSDSGKGENKKL